jgi:ParB family transcriptional regulator, chromosome partitioning protein
MASKAQLAKMAEMNTLEHREAIRAVPTEDDPDIVGRQTEMIRLDSISPSPYQPRMSFPDAEIASLAETIKEGALVQPIVVRRVAGDGYQLIAGERRWRAHKLLGKRTIEARIIAASDEQAALMSLVENIQRKDLTDFETSEGIARIQATFPTRVKLAESLGMSKQEVTRYLKFTELPESIRAGLLEKPYLLGRSAAEAIVSALRGIRPSAALDGRIAEALRLLTAGKIDQAKVAAFLRETSDTTRQPSSQPTYLENRAGKRVGSVTTGAKGIVVKIKNDALSDEQMDKLQQFIAKLVR